jgi:hypothetical protein
MAIVTLGIDHGKNVLSCTAPMRLASRCWCARACPWQITTGGNLVAVLADCHSDVLGRHQ